MCHNNCRRTTALGLLAKRTGKTCCEAEALRTGTKGEGDRRKQSHWPLCQGLCCTERPPRKPGTGKEQEQTGKPNTGRRRQQINSTTFMNLVDIKLHFDITNFISNAPGIAASFEWFNYHVDPASREKKNALDNVMN